MKAAVSAYAIKIKRSEVWFNEHNIVLLKTSNVKLVGDDSEKLDNSSVGCVHHGPRLLDSS